MVLGVPVLTARAGRFCGLVQFPGSVRKKVLLQLLLLLCHPFPLVSAPPSGFRGDAGASLDTGAGLSCIWVGVGHPAAWTLGFVGAAAVV